MISVIISTYNGKDFIDRTIKSIFEQSEKNIEVILVDDGSDMETCLKIKDLADSNLKIKSIRIENSGPGVARDTGIKSAEGHLIALLDDDDYWVNTDKLKNQKEYFNINPQHVLIGAERTILVNEKGHRLNEYFNPPTDGQIRKKMFWKNCFITSSVLFKKEAYIKAGGFSNMRLSEDYDLWLRMGKIGKMANIENADVAYTIRSASASKQKRFQLLKNNLNLIMKYRKDYPHSWLGILKRSAQITLLYLKNLF